MHPTQAPLSESEFHMLIKLAKKVLWADRETKRRIQAHAINIIPANFYSEVPTVEQIENSFEYLDQQRGPFHSLKIFQQEKIEAFTRQILHYGEEFNPPQSGNVTNPQGFFWTNPAFSYSDAMSYYCMIRHFKPQRILEIGSGYSTLVAHEAIQKNGFGRLVLIEPYPKHFLKKLDTVDTIREELVQNIPVSALVDEIEQSDLWFIDSTHTVKNGSDCLYIYLKAMPEVQKDIVVHTHDVFLPFPYSQQRIIDKHITWTEQYLLYAYMLDNPKIEILFGSMYIKTFLPHLMDALMKGKYPGGGGSLWYMLRGSNS